VSAFTSDTTLLALAWATGMVGPEMTSTRARFSPEVFSHHQQVAGLSRMSITFNGLSG